MKLKLEVLEFQYAYQLSRSKKMWISRFRRTLFFLTIQAGLLCLVMEVRGQSLGEPGIERRLEMIKSGQIDEVRAELPGLVTRYQNHPGVLYLQGVLTSDGTEAVKIFQSVFDNFPKSEWADDALYKIYQYYYSLGLYTKASDLYDRLRREYPGSPYLTSAEARRTGRELEEGEKVRTPHVEESGTFAVQVGAFSTVENANKQRSFLRNVGYPVEILNKVKGGKSFYLVWIGNFKSYEEARKFGTEVKARYKIESIVVER